MKQALVLLLFFSALFFWPMSFEQFETPKSWALISFACFAAFAVDWKQILKDEMAAVLFAFVISCAISTFFSIDQHMSFWGNPQCPNGLLVNFSYFVVYLAVIRRMYLVNWSYGWHYELINAVIISATVLSAYAIAQVFGYDFMQWHGTIIEGKFVRPPSTMGHPNFMAGYLAMVLPFALSRVDRYGIIRGVKIASICFMVVAIILSQSRGMWLSAATSLLVYLFLTNAPLKSIVKGLGAILVLVSIVFLAIPQFRYGAQYRARDIFSPGESRIYYPTAALKIWQKYPFFGSGLDTFETAFQHERNSRYWEIEKAGSPTRAHCELLNILATQGLFGFLIVIYLTAVILWRLNRQRDPAIAGAIAAFYVQNISGFTVISTGILFALCLALLKEPV